MRDKYLDLVWELKKYESDANTYYNWWAEYSSQSTGRETGGLENKMSGSHSKNKKIIIYIGQNTEKILATCCHSHSSGKLSAYVGVKSSQKSNHQSHNKRMQQISTAGVKDYTQLSGQRDPLVDVVQEI